MPALPTCPSSNSSDIRYQARRGVSPIWLDPDMVEGSNVLRGMTQRGTPPNA